MKKVQERTLLPGVLGVSPIPSSPKIGGQGVDTEKQCPIGGSIDGTHRCSDI